jgi:hypothetical protein
MIGIVKPIMAINTIPWTSHRGERGLSFIWLNLKSSYNNKRRGDDQALR